jgi:hypothetical protein
MLGEKYLDKEIKDGIIPDPSTLDPITGEPLPQPQDQSSNTLGKMPSESEVDASSTQVQ